MTRAEARTAVRTATEHDTDTQVTDTQLNAWIDIEHKNLRRKLEQAVPSLYTATDSNQVMSGSSDSLTLPSDFERLVRLERQVGSGWIPVDVSDGLNPHIGGELTQREEGTAFKLAPASFVPGTYRLIYVQKPATLTADSGAGGTLLVPDGCEDIITELVSARVKERDQDDPSPHLRRAADTWAEQRSALRRRYGNHGEPGLAIVRGW